MGHEPSRPGDIAPHEQRTASAEAFLAGTYDERMYEELRMRAQIFEVLTGGEVAADSVEGQDDVDEAEGRERGLRLVPLPPAMVEDLRVHLGVWMRSR